MRAATIFLLMTLLACASPPAGPVDPSADLHSHANPGAVRMTHVDLDLEVDFDARQLRGACTLDVEGTPGDLILDTYDLAIASVAVAGETGEFRAAAFELGPADPVLGAPLLIERGSAPRVRVEYATGERATGPQWLGPAQTEGGEHPFLYTQSQAIQARSWMPVQDTPAVRVTYTARVRTPPRLLAVMSAEMPSEAGRGGDYRFSMPLPIPPYLISLAVGDLEFRPTSARTGVYAEPGVVEAAAREFEDTEAMMRTAEALYGPYRWGRYDILVLPPAYPFGGMENPRLTFLSPTVIAGDKSLVNIVAHELAHSWSGNLATNATWRDFWLNEGFTVYIEERIQEAVYGKERADMEAALEVADLKEEMAAMDARDQILHIDLAGRGPDDGFSSVPYVKGAMFLRTIEQAVGRQAFDAFLRGYFDEFAFRSLTTPQFAAYLDAELLSRHPDARAAIDMRDWLEAPGLPEGRHEPASAELEEVDAVARGWIGGDVATAALETGDWTTQHWLGFLRALPADLGPGRMAELDGRFGFTSSGNAEILCEWLILSLENDYARAEARLREFLTSVGRRKFLKPMYEQLVETPRGRALAAEIYAAARPGYHALAVQTIDRIVGRGAAPRD